MEEVPFEDRVVPRVEIDWERSFWWWYPLTRAIHPALRMTSLLAGLIGIILLQWGLSSADKWFSPAFDCGIQFGWSGADWMSQPRWELTGNFPAISLNNLAYFSFVVLWIALISGILGGVLARRAAIELGQRNIASWIQAFQVAIKRLVSSLWAAGMYFVGIIALLVPVLVLGWIARFGVVAAAVAGVLLLLAFLPLISAAGRTLLSLVVCFPLSICAICVEKRADAFEGFGRSNAYLFQRPVVAVMLIVGLVLLGEVGAFLVYWTIQLGWGIVGEAFLMAAGRNDNALTYHEAGAWFADHLIAAFRFSYFWSATAALYLILRRCVDNTELEEIEMFDSALEKKTPQIPSTSRPAESPESRGSSAQSEVPTPESQASTNQNSENQSSESPASDSQPPEDQTSSSSS